MTKVTQGIPPNSGESFLVTLVDGTQHVLFFCPQLGWIDSNHTPYVTSDMLSYSWHSE